jgi:cephalosporin hydroxylase
MDRTFEEIFQSHTGRPSMKWGHYFKIYDTHFQRFRGNSPSVLEIGIRKGGSLQIWREYFGAGSRVIGVDIDPECRALEEDGFEVFIGDQGDPAFLLDIVEQVGPFDIVIDDGSHRMDDLRTSFATLFPILKSGGLYMVEDAHTCYMADFDGGYRKPGTFIENAKTIIDQMHAFYSEDHSSFAPNALSVTVNAVHFYDSIVVIEKNNRYDESTGAVLKREGQRSGTMTE